MLLLALDSGDEKNSVFFSPAVSKYVSKKPSSLLIGRETHMLVKIPQLAGAMAKK